MAKVSDCQTVRYGNQVSSQAFWQMPIQIESEADSDSRFQALS